MRVLSVRTTNAELGSCNIYISPFPSLIASYHVILGAIIGTGQASGVPGFVWAILVVYFIGFNSFPVNMVLQYRRRGWFVDALWLGENGGRGGSGYYVGERLYQVQSLVSKSLLLWLVIGGANQPNAYTKGT